MLRLSFLVFAVAALIAAVAQAAPVISWSCGRKSMGNVWRPRASVTVTSWRN